MHFATISQYSVNLNKVDVAASGIFISHLIKLKAQFVLQEIQSH